MNRFIICIFFNYSFIYVCTFIIHVVIHLDYRLLLNTFMDSGESALESLWHLQTDCREERGKLSHFSDFGLWESN